MSLINASINGNFVTRHLQRIAADHFPTKMKQVLFVISGIAIVIRDRTPSLDLLWQVNSRLRSGYRTSYMVIPAYVSPALWKDIGATLGLVCPSMLCPACKISQLSDSDLWRIGMVFATRCPEWLKYGSMQLMATDIHDNLALLGRIKLG